MKAHPRPNAIDRRRVLAAGGGLLLSSALPASARPRACDENGIERAQDGRAPAEALDKLLEAHVRVLPERAGAGANHYTMAAEALETLGYASEIPSDWSAGASGYAGSTTSRT